MPENKGRVVYVDVDDTLIRSVGDTRIAMPRTVEYVQALKANGDRVYCWSTGGAEYARATAEELGIVDCFEGFLPKPDVMIDDQLISEWRNLQLLHPFSLPAPPRPIEPDDEV